jgi:hypothetical protein
MWHMHTMQPLRLLRSGRRYDTGVLSWQVCASLAHMACLKQALRLLSYRNAPSVALPVEPARAGRPGAASHGEALVAPPLPATMPVEPVLGAASQGEALQVAPPLPATMQAAASCSVRTQSKGKLA